MGMEKIFRIWPSMAELAADIEAPYSTVAAWRRRGRIPAARDWAVIEAACRRGVKLTFEDLARARRGEESAPDPCSSGEMTAREGKVA